MSELAYPELLTLADRSAPDAVRRYPGQFVALLGDRVLDSDRDLIALASRIDATMSRSDRRWILYVDPAPGPRSLAYDPPQDRESRRTHPNAPEAAVAG